jgi:hypothetical protein
VQHADGTVLPRAIYREGRLALLAEANFSGLLTYIARLRIILRILHI